MKKLTFKEYERLMVHIPDDELTVHWDSGRRWFEVEIRFEMDDREYAKLIRFHGHVPVDAEGREILPD